MITRDLFRVLLGGSSQVRMVIRVGPGCVLPDHLLGEAYVLLNFDHVTPSYTALTMGDRHVEATLGFNGRPFHVHIPWACVHVLEAPGLAQITFPVHDAPAPEAAPPRKLRLVH